MYLFLKNNKYIDFNMINIKDIYGYINYNKKYLDYENINYKWIEIR